MAESGSDSLKHNDKTVIADWQPVGFVQQHFFIDNIEDNPSYFSIHRARIGISGNLNKKINLNFVIGALEPPDRKPAMVNAFADFSIHPLFNLRTGQFLVPFGLEGPEVITLNPAIERAYPTRQINNYRMFRDIGLMLQGTYLFINYSFAALNGTGANVPENIDPKDFVFRTIFTLSPDIKAGFSAQTGKFENTEGVIRNRQKWAVHSEYDFDSGFLRGEFIKQYTDRDPEPEKTVSLGGYLLAGYRVSDEINFISRYEYYSPGNDATYKYHGVMLGVNYFFNSRTRFSVNGTGSTFTRIGNNMQYVMNMQLQFVL